MSFNWIKAYVTGYTTGAVGEVISGIQINEPLTLVITGLKYGTTGLNYLWSAYFTGIGTSASGSAFLEDKSGQLAWADDQWQTYITFNNRDDAGKYTTGYIDLWFNSGVSISTGIKLLTGNIELYDNDSAVAWDMITNLNGAINNADTQHTHAGEAGGATDLDDLTDVAIDGALSYTDGKVLRADGNSYEESWLNISDIPNLANWSGDMITPVSYTHLRAHET